MLRRVGFTRGLTGTAFPRLRCCEKALPRNVPLPDERWKMQHPGMLFRTDSPLAKSSPLAGPALTPRVLCREMPGRNC